MIIEIHADFDLCKLLFVFSKTQSWVLVSGVFSYSTTISGVLEVTLGPVLISSILFLPVILRIVRFLKGSSFNGTMDHNHRIAKLNSQLVIFWRELCLWCDHTIISDQQKNHWLGWLGWFVSHFFSWTVVSSKVSLLEAPCSLSSSSSSSSPLADR